MKKVLIITYYWPPGSGSGVQRFLKFSKYLQDFGWEPVILTVKNGTFPAYDESLENDIPKNIKVFRTKTFEPFAWYSLLTGNKSNSTNLNAGTKKNTFLKRLLLYIRANFFIPDARKGWYPYACKKAKSIIENESIDAIITTGPPHSTHLIGHHIKKHFKTPWIADMRDPWTSIFYNDLFPRSKSTKRKDKALEDKVIKSADLVTVVSQGMYDEFSVNAKRICTIYNGYDEDDFKDVKKQRPSQFTVCYTGKFLSSQNVESLWKVLKDLVLENEDFKNDLKINLVGNVEQNIFDSINSFHLSSFLKFDGFLSHKAAIEKMSESALLLFIVPKSENNHLIITGKLFEYLAVLKPILSLGPQGNASEILTENGRSPMIDYDNYNEIKSQIMSTYEDWKNSKSYSLSSEKVSQFSRKKLTGLLAEQLNSLT